jgi:hypothetical protein
MTAAPVHATKPQDDARPHPYTLAVVTEALRRIEAAGPLDDHAEVQQALRDRATRTDQLQERAWLLGQRLDLPQELARWRFWGRWVMLVLAALLALAGFAAARSVLAPDRSINAVAALASLLGLHAITLVVWIVELVWSYGARSHVAGGDRSLGRFALAITARLPWGQNPHRLQLLRASVRVLQRERLWPWFIGMLSHSIWALELALTLVVLLFGFAFQAYHLSWETTILTPAFFQKFVHLTGHLPALLGLPIPDAAEVQQVGSAAKSALGDPLAQRAWAWWLIGCVAVYGFLPRLLLALLSFWRWNAGSVRVKPIDPADPYTQRILQHLDAQDPGGHVIDADNGDTGRARARAPFRAQAIPGTWALIGFELPPEAAWPPADLPPTSNTQRIEGGAREREQAIDRLRSSAPEALVLAVHAASSPDRGTARFVRGVVNQVQRCALLLVSSSDDDDVADTDDQRWARWLNDEGLGDVRLFASTDAARDWVAPAPAPRAP